MFCFPVIIFLLLSSNNLPSIYNSSYKRTALPGRHTHFKPFNQSKNCKTGAGCSPPKDCETVVSPKWEKAVPFVGECRPRVLPDGPACCSPSHPAPAPHPHSRPRRARRVPAGDAPAHGDAPKRAVSVSEGDYPER